MNIVLLPYVDAVELLAVPGTQRVRCAGCGKELLATPASLQTAGVDGVFICKLCSIAVLALVEEPIQQVPGGGQELRAAGLAEIADNDEALARRLQDAQRRMN